MNTLPVLDIVFVALLFVCAIVGMVQGLWNELLNKAALVLGVWVAVLFCSRLALRFYPNIKNPMLAMVVAFLILFTAAFLVVKIIQYIVQQFLQNEILGPLNRTLGFVFGLIEGLALVILILIVLKVQPWFKTGPLLESSVFYRVLEPIVLAPVRTLQDFVSGPGNITEIDVSGDGV